MRSDPEQQSTKKILGFDNWTEGSQHFERLLPEMSSCGMSLILVHLGSWGNDPGRPFRETIGALDVRDISFYSGKSFDEILQIERPDAVLLFSTQTFAHRAFLRYCKQSSIPTLHAYHGIVNVQATNNSSGSYTIDHVAYARFVISKLTKLFRYTFPCYVTALWKTNANTRAWFRFISDIYRMALGKPCLLASEDAQTSKVAVYTTADVEHAVRTYGLSEADVQVVGNPDLARFGLTQDMLGIRNTKNVSEFESVMYIDTGLVALGLQFEDANSFVEHLQVTSRLLAAQEKRLLFKPHPANDLKFLERSLAGTGIEIISNKDMLLRVQQCSACIVETTTLALVPSLLGIPLLFANYGELRGLRFGPVLTSYPRGYVLDDVERVNDILANDKESLDVEAVKEWIDLNSGPLPAEDVSRRVVRILESIIVDNKQENLGS